MLYIFVYLTNAKKAWGYIYEIIKDLIHIEPDAMSARVSILWFDKHSIHRSFL